MRFPQSPTREHMNTQPIPVPALFPARILADMVSIAAKDTDDRYAIEALTRIVCEAFDGASHTEEVTAEVLRRRRL